jgi:hypothetical protein
MITRVPALEFIHSKAGRYCNADLSVEVLIRTYGKGISLEINGPRGSHSLGVIGVRGDGLECFSLVGLPNVVHFTGRLERVTQSGPDGRIEFNSEVAQVSLTLSFVGPSVTLEICVGSWSKESFALLKA